MLKRSRKKQRGLYRDTLRNAQTSCRIAKAFFYLLLTIVVFKLTENCQNPECQTHHDYENVAVSFHDDRTILG